MQYPPSVSRESATKEEARKLELPVEGMSCASCANRVEKHLNEVDGVEASVNYATHRAAVELDPGVSTEALLDAVASAGYAARIPDAGKGSSPGEEHAPNGSDDHSAHTGSSAKEEHTLRVRSIFAAVVSVPMFLVAMIPPLQFDYWQWLSLVLATPVVFWAGLTFHRVALRHLRHGHVSMDTLISLGTLAAWGWSVAALLFLGAGDPGMRMSFALIPEQGAGTDEVYFEVAALVTTFLLVGRYFEARAKRRAGSALEALLELGAKDAAVLDENGTERRIPIDDLETGMRFVVRPGEKLATDGMVVEGSSAIDASLLTGESVPVEVGPGDAVTGATVNAGGRLVIEATRVGSETSLAQIARLVADAQSGKAPVQRLADRISAVFVPFVIALALATLGFWLAADVSAAYAFTAAVAVLIVACPCALGLATPMALLVGTGRGAQLGLLIKGPEVLESTRRIDTIVLDKTGTITTGEMAVGGLTLGDGVEEAAALRLIGGVESASEHPIARAIAAHAESAVGPLPAPTDFASTAGLGVEGEIDGRRVLIGRPGHLEQHGYAMEPELADAAENAARDGRTAVAAGWDGAVRAIVVVADPVKPSSAAAIAGLRELGLEPILLSGDSRSTASSVAAEVDISEVIAEVLPEQKSDVIGRLQSEGRTVAMVGDGVNDAPALARADLGLAIGTGTDAAIEASDLTLVSGDLRAAADAIRLSRRTLKTIKGNLFWAFAYNVAALPLAASGYLNPLVAGAAMAFSSVFVVLNSLRLRSFDARSGTPSDPDRESHPAGV